MATPNNLVEVLRLLQSKSLQCEPDAARARRLITAEIEEAEALRAELAGQVHWKPETESRTDTLKLFRENMEANAARIRELEDALSKAQGFIKNHQARLMAATFDGSEKCDYCHGVGACPRCWGRAAITRLEKRFENVRQDLGAIPRSLRNLSVVGEKWAGLAATMREHYQDEANMMAARVDALLGIEPGCTDNSPCEQPMLRWVHSKTCMDLVAAKRKEPGVVEMTKGAFDDMLEYSTTLPTGTTLGKRWKCRRPVRDDGRGPPDWYQGEYVEEKDPALKAKGYVGIVWKKIKLIPTHFAIWSNLIKEQTGCTEAMDYFEALENLAPDEKEPSRVKVYPINKADCPVCKEQS